MPACQLIHLPQRRWLVDAVEEARGLGEATLVHAACVDDDAQCEPASIAENRLSIAASRLSIALKRCCRSRTSVVSVRTRAPEQIEIDPLVAHLKNSLNWRESISV